MSGCRELSPLWLPHRVYSAAVSLVAVLGGGAFLDQGQDPRTFKTRTEIVTLDVAVTDASGRPLSGLTASDFTVLEGGDVQSIATFTEVNVAPVPWVAPWMGEIRHDVTTNEVARGRLTVIVLDDALLDGNPALVTSMRDAAKTIIAGLGPEDRASVVFTKDSRQAQPFTSDRARLGQAVDRLKAGSLKMGTSALDDLVDGMYMLGALSTLDNAIRTLGTTRHVPKALIYIGVGVEIDWSMVTEPKFAGEGQGATLATQQLHLNYRDHLRSILRNAALWNIPVHTVDPAGLRTELRGGGGSPIRPPGDPEFLHTLSANTGGVSVAHTNDFAPGLERVDNATRSVYLLGYVPPPTSTRLRRIEVKVNRPGAIVRSRSYIERPPDSGDDRTKADRPPPGLVALSGLLPEPGMPLRITAVPFPVGTRGQATIAIALGVRHPGGEHRRVESLTLNVSAFDMEGKFMAGTRGTAEVRVSETRLGPIEYEVYSRLPVSPGRYQLRVSVDNRSRGETGSVYTDVEVPDFSQAGLHVAGLLIDAGPARLKGAPADAFVEILPLLPTSQREFRSGTRVVAFARLIQGGRQALAPVAVTARLLNEAGQSVRSGSSTVHASDFARQRAADYRLGLSTEGLAPGWYLFTLEAAVTNGTPIRKDAALRVLAAEEGSR